MLDIKVVLTLVNNVLTVEKFARKREDEEWKLLDTKTKENMVLVRRLLHEGTRAEMKAYRKG